MHMYAEVDFEYMPNSLLPPKHYSSSFEYLNGLTVVSLNSNQVSPSPFSPSFTLMYE